MYTKLNFKTTYVLFVIFFFTISDFIGAFVYGLGYVFAF